MGNFDESWEFLGNTGTGTSMFNQQWNFERLITTVLNWAGDALAIGFFENAVDLSGDLVQLDDKFAGTLKELIAETEFKGSVGSSATTRVGGGSQIRKIIIVG